MPIPKRLRWWSVPIALIPLAVVRAGLLAEPDTFWQIRVGLDILRQGRIPDTDPYSWSAWGTEWHPNSWAFDVLLAEAYRFGGLAAAALAAAAFIPLTAGAVGLLARRLGARPGVVTLIVLVTFTPLLVWFSARPQMVDYAVVPFLLVLLDVAMKGERRAARVSAVAGILVVQVVWVNLHLVAPLGIAVLALAAVGHLITSPRKRRAGWIGAAAVAAAMVGTLASPFGWTVVTIAGDVHDSSSVIVEWGHFTFSKPVGDLLLAMCLLGLFGSWRMRRPDLLLPLGLLTAAGLYAIRMLPVAAVVAAAVLAAWTSASPRRSAYFDSRRALIRFAVVALVLAETVVGVVKGTPGQARYPIALVRQIPAGCRLFNGYTLGGLVILFRPDVKVSQDSRSDLYGRDALISANETEFGTHGADDLDRAQVTCALITPGSALSKQLQARGDWREVGGDPTGVLYARTSTASGTTP
ncbi:MAG: hypothetical protein HOV71_02055 [Hamadaea sp.]|nr:hypothetical protein [Hamadaea sp.]NUR46896.1 hypothetical protein [Hamadaea sp.]